MPGGSTEVTIEIWIQEINSLSASKAELDMDLYLSESWLDPSLRFEHMHPCRQNLSLPHEMLYRIWTPNTAFINSKWLQLHRYELMTILVTYSLTLLIEV